MNIERVSCFKQPDLIRDLLASELDRAEKSRRCGWGSIYSADGVVDFRHRGCLNNQATFKLKKSLARTRQRRRTSRRKCASARTARNPGGPELKKSAMKLSEYEITLRQVLYDPDIWLKTPEQIARWLNHCADNAHTRFAQFAADEKAA